GRSAACMTSSLFLEKRSFSNLLYRLSSKLVQPVKFSVSPAVKANKVAYLLIEIFITFFLKNQYLIPKATIVFEDKSPSNLFHHQTLYFVVRDLIQNMK